MRKSHASPHTTGQIRVAVDCVIFGVDDDSLRILLIRRAGAPFANAWALPGGFIHEDESLDAAAKRELAEETGLTGVYLEQLYTFGEPQRDPRGRVISAAYFALVRLDGHVVRASTDAKEAAWFATTDLPKLAFDHDRILEVAVGRLRAKIRYEPVGFELLPKSFTLGRLQRLYEIVLERELDKRNFRRKVLSMGLLRDTGETEQDVAHRAARLFEFDESAYRRLSRSGFNFEL